MIKKIELVVCSVFVVSTLYAQFVTIDISQQVRRDISRLQTMNGDYSLKKEDVSKNITFTVKSSKYVKLLVLIFTSSGGDIKKEFVEGYATSTKLFEKTITPSSGVCVCIPCIELRWSNSIPGMFEESAEGVG